MRYPAHWHREVLLNTVFGPTLEHYVPLAFRAQLSLISCYTGTATAINHDALPRRGTWPPRPHLKTFAAVTSFVLFSISAKVVYSRFSASPDGEVGTVRNLTLLTLLPFVELTLHISGPRASYTSLRRYQGELLHHSIRSITF